MMHELNKLYDSSFYDNQSDGSYKSAKIILPIIFSVFKPKSIIDFGAGVGTFLKAAHECGVDDLLGVEGAWTEGKHPSFIPYLYCDLEGPIKIDRVFDLAICMEVAEHLSEKRAVSFIEDICRCANVVLFSAALPGQGGTNHINEQLATYWVKLFEDNGCEVFDFLRADLWGNSDVAPWYRQNSYIFVKKECDQKKIFYHKPIFNIVHPAFSIPVKVIAKQKTSKILKALLRKVVD